MVGETGTCLAFESDYAFVLVFLCLFFAGVKLILFFFFLLLLNNSS